MTRDLIYALRMILSHRWFSAAIVATLAMGIGLNTMVFALVNAVLFRPLDLPGGDRLVAINSQERANPENKYGTSYPDFRDFRASATAFEAIEAASDGDAVLSEKEHPPQSYQMTEVTPGLFPMLRMPPILGRMFTAADGMAGAPPVVLLGYGVWKDRYGASPEVIGRSVRVNEKPATIIGVMPAGFKFPQRADLWTPLQPSAAMEKRDNRALQVFAYLKPGVTVTQGTANLSTVANQLSKQYTDADKDSTAVAQTFHDRYNGGPIKIVFLSMLGAVGLVLLIACANVANMMLGRALSRRREISIRVAMGASRWQVMRQLLIESVMLSFVGGAAGLGLAAIGIHTFDQAVQDVGKPYWILFRMDWQAFAYCAAVCVASGILFGLAPALRASRIDLNGTLKDGTRTAGSRRGGFLSAALVVGQFALTMVLLAGAGLFVRSFFDALSLNAEIPASRILSARYHLPATRYATTEARAGFANRLAEQLRALPGVTQAAIVSDPPELGAMRRGIEIEGRPDDPKHRPEAAFEVQLPGYFATVNLPLQQGRDFTDDDGGKGKETAIVSRQFAEKFWPRENAVGKRFRTYPEQDKAGPWLTIVGVAANLVQEAQTDDPKPLAFLPDRLEGNYWMSLLVRTGGDPAAMAPAVRKAVQDLDQDLPLNEVRVLQAAIERNRWFLSVFGTLFGAFAAIGMLMASVGIYAVIAQATGSRTQEIGVRMALGATSGNILRLVLGRGMRQMILGVLFGLAAAIPAVKVLSKIAVRVSPTDPVAFAAIVAILASVGLFACWLPARRAARLDPVKAIRYE